MTDKEKIRAEIDKWQKLTMDENRILVSDSAREIRGSIEGLTDCVKALEKTMIDEYTIQSKNTIVKELQSTNVIPPKYTPKFVFKLVKSFIKEKHFTIL